MNWIIASNKTPFDTLLLSFYYFKLFTKIHSILNILTFFIVIIQLNLVKFKKVLLIFSNSYLFAIK